MFGIKSFTGILLVVVLMQLTAVLCQELYVNNKGLCKTQTPQSIRRCRRRKNCKVEYVQNCCDGWEFIDGKCVPQCEPKCINGTCNHQHKCECTSPLKLKGHSCVLPTCDPPCFNGICVDDNVCKCNHDTTSFNSTHCVRSCRAGYFNDPIGGYFKDPIECKPRCEKQCTNSLCTAPNTCSCINGYKHLENDSTTCVPECNPACINGECVAPGTCSCSIKYTVESPETPHKCKPVCTNCVYGDCIAPDTCKCHEGYTKRNDICTPDCDKTCVNGICSEPNKCTCNVGYQLDPNDKYNCKPTCNHECVNASCVEVNKCLCLPGYVTENEWSCKPNCSSCENGECVGPENCQCREGYSKKDDGKCSPDCKKSCIRGQCIAPDVCSCLEGYTLEKDNFTCSPTCDEGCINSKCVLLNKCECLPGYKRYSSSECKPICHSCNDGDCVAPNKCRCHVGYKAINGSGCTAICLQPCVNGFCSNPDKCECKDGYIHNSTEPSICYKPCEGACDFGKCNEHGECICDLGYKEQNGTCVAVPLIDCTDCRSNCEDSCVCEDLPSRPPCISYLVKEASSTSMAGLQLTWVIGGVVGLLLVLIVVVIQRIWTKRHAYDYKTPDKDGSIGSVIYTLPDTLIRTRSLPDLYDSQDMYYEEVAQADNSAPYENELEETCGHLLERNM